MRLVEVEEAADGEALPLVYDPEKIAAFWSRRPVAVTTRILQARTQGVAALASP